LSFGSIRELSPAFRPLSPGLHWPALLFCNWA
jgi:hypothetical protein